MCRTSTRAWTCVARNVASRVPNVTAASPAGAPCGATASPSAAGSRRVSQHTSRRSTFFDGVLVAGVDDLQQALADVPAGVACGCEGALAVGSMLCSPPARSSANICRLWLICHHASADATTNTIVPASVARKRRTARDVKEPRSLQSIARGRFRCPHFVQ